MLKLSLSDFGDAYILVLKLSLSHYNDAYLLVKGTKTVANTGKVTVPNNRNVRVIVENYWLHKWNKQYTRLKML